MTGLVESYKKIKGSIVAFVPKYVPVTSDESPPLFPPIIGTGFVAREDGIIVTNDHVVRAFGKVFRPPESRDDDWPVYAILLHAIPAGQLQIPLEILGAAVISEFTPGNIYYGPPSPDVAFVHVKVRELTPIRISDLDDISEGAEVATAGFPMGTDALTAPGYLHQITPTLQRGIVSAVLPFASTRPHAFTINVMTQGGASGSPVFDSSSGEVLGVLYAGLNDLGLTEAKDLYRQPTNISYVVPSHYVRYLLAKIGERSDIASPRDAQTIEEMIRTKEVVNAFGNGGSLQAERINLRSNPEETRGLTELKRFTVT